MGTGQVYHFFNNGDGASVLIFKQWGRGLILKRVKSRFICMILVMVLVSSCGKKDRREAENHVLTNECSFQETDFIKLEEPKTDGEVIKRSNQTYLEHCSYEIRTIKKQNIIFYELYQYSVTEKAVKKITIDMKDCTFQHGYFTKLTSQKDANGLITHQAIFTETIADTDTNNNTDSESGTVQSYWMLSLDVDAAIKDYYQIDKEEIEKVESSNNQNGKVAYLVYDKTEYYITEQELIRCKDDVEEILFSLSDAGIGNRIRGISIIDENNILLWRPDMDSQTMSVYMLSDIQNKNIDEKEDQNEDKLIIADVTTLAASDYIKGCAAAYSRENKDIHITYEQDKINPDAYRTRILADVMNGEGPDMLWVSEDDMIVLYEKGVLLSLNDMITDDIKKQVWPAVIEIGSIDGSYVGVAPEVYTSWNMVSDSVWNKNYWSLQEFLSATQKSTFDIYSKYNYLGQLSSVLYPNISEVDNDFDGELFISFLEYCRTNQTKYEEFFGTGQYSSDSGSYTCMINSLGATDIGAYDEIMAEYEDEYHIINFATEESNTGYGYIYSNYYLVVNVNTPNKALLEGFIRYLFDENEQIYHTNDNRIREDAVRDSFYVWETNDGKTIIESLSDEFGGALLSVRADGSNRIEEYITFLRNCKPYPRVNTVISTILEEEIEIFLNSGKTAEETAKIIQNRIQLYKNETR